MQTLTGGKDAGNDRDGTAGFQSLGQLDEALLLDEEIHTDLRPSAGDDDIIVTKFRDRYGSDANCNDQIDHSSVEIDRCISTAL